MADMFHILEKAEARATVRHHAELVSTSTFPRVAVPLVEPWTLNQVQGDGLFAYSTALKGAQ